MKKEEIDKLISSINSEHKNDMFVKLDGLAKPMPRTSAGRLSIDVPFGGGSPNGKIIELFGKESSGKTTIALHMVASFQKNIPDKIAAFIDYEHAFDPQYAANLGVDVNSLVFAQPMFAEQGLEGIEALIDTGNFSIIVVDSVSAMTPKSEIEGDMTSHSVGVQAKLMSKAMRKLVGKANMQGTLVVFINQMREKIGVMFGNPWTTTGGNALKFYSSIRAEIKKSKVTKDGDDIVGVMGSLYTAKNKTAPPFQTSVFEIGFGVGIKKEAEILDYGVEFGVIKKAGSWFSYNDTKLGQGRASVIELLESNPELTEELEEKVYAKIYD